jgi:hypothetical protein
MATTSATRPSPPFTRHAIDLQALRALPRAWQWALPGLHLEQVHPERDRGGRLWARSSQSQAVELVLARMNPFCKMYPEPESGWRWPGRGRRPELHQFDLPSGCANVLQLQQHRQHALELAVEMGLVPRQALEAVWVEHLTVRLDRGRADGAGVPPGGRVRLVTSKGRDGFATVTIPASNSHFRCEPERGVITADRLLDLEPRDGRFVEIGWSCSGMSVGGRVMGKFPLRGRERGQEVLVPWNAALLPDPSAMVAVRIVNSGP